MEFALAVSVFALVVTVLIGSLQLRSASKSLQINAVVSLLSMIDDCQRGLNEHKNNRKQLNLSIHRLMNKLDMYALLVNNRHIRDVELRNFLEEHYVELLEDIIDYGDEDELKNSYKDAYELYQKLKEGSWKRRISMTFQFEATSK